jgi:hypothetical protein
MSRPDRARNGHGPACALLAGPVHQEVEWVFRCPPVDLLPLPSRGKQASLLVRRQLPGMGRAAPSVVAVVLLPQQPGVPAPSITPENMELLASYLSAGVRPHSRTVLSSLPLASSSPSGLNATPRTESVWPVRVAR